MIEIDIAWPWHARSYFLYIWTRLRCRKGPSSDIAVMQAAAPSGDACRPARTARSLHSYSGVEISLKLRLQSVKIEEKSAQTGGGLIEYDCF